MPTHTRVDVQLLPPLTTGSARSNLVGDYELLRVGTSTFRFLQLLCLPKQRTRARCLLPVQVCIWGARHALHRTANKSVRMHKHHLTDSEARA